jgi:hypothetical protein
MVSESFLQKEIQILVTALGGRVFRNNVAKGWVGEFLGFKNGTLQLGNARVLHAGLCVGSADLIGWTADGRFLALEIKSTRGAVREAQHLFIDAVNRSGGVGIVVRSIEDVRSRLCGSK